MSTHGSHGSHGSASSKGTLLKVGLGVAAVGAVIFFATRSSAAIVSPDGPANPAPPPPGRRTSPANPPAGSGVASVVPNSLGGMIVRSGPGTNTGQVSNAFNGDTVAVIQQGIPQNDGAAIAQGVKAGQPVEWWRIMAPDGVIGFSRATDPTTGAPNFNLTAAPTAQPPVTAGLLRPRVIARSYGGGMYQPVLQRRW